MITYDAAIKTDAKVKDLPYIPAGEYLSWDEKKNSWVSNKGNIKDVLTKLAQSILSFSISMKRKRIILKILMIILVVIQVLGYIGTLTAKKVFPEEDQSFAFYLGFNLPLILATILFANERSIKRKMDKKKSEEIIDSIGKS